MINLLLSVANDSYVPFVPLLCAHLLHIDFFSERHNTHQMSPSPEYITYGTVQIAERDHLARLHVH